MRSDAATVEAYLAERHPERREALATIRAVIVENLPSGFEEGMQYGMIGYYIPLSRYSTTYTGEPLSLVGLAAQKRHLALYLMGSYADEEERAWVRQRWERAGKRLDRGKSCVRFRTLDDVPVEVVGEAIARSSVDDLIAAYERTRPAWPERRRRPVKAS